MPDQQGGTFLLPSEAKPNTSFPYFLPSIWASTPTVLPVPGYQLPAAPSTSGGLTYDLSLPPDAQEQWAPSATLESEGFPSFYATDLIAVPVRALRDPPFQSGWWMTQGAEPPTSFWDLDAPFQETVQGPAATVSALFAFSKVCAETTNHSSPQEDQ
ncbi:hypothetical protein PsYK624_148120 [Phanerochaete sordida]|uniref:Uncharacterized protein n=1 Tax=Phanerochaete sordida TaxID=48140 RepID=A0A9P3GQN5_9APHY|nr:hypothetical protein PsYK624_148120 [Phanerochaete sordida]